MLIFLSKKKFNFHGCHAEVEVKARRTFESSGDFEIHVSKVILQPHDIGEYEVFKRGSFWALQRRLILAAEMMRAKNPECKTEKAKLMDGNGWPC